MKLLPNKNANAYENAMIALFGAILLGVTSVFATLLYRAMPFLFNSLRTQDNGIAVPGGMDWIFTVNANGNLPCDRAGSRHPVRRLPGGSDSSASRSHGIQQFSFSVSRRFLDGVMERRLG